MVNDLKVDSYRSQTKLQKGNVFTSVCQEFCPQGGGVHPLCRPLLGRHPPLAHPLCRHKPPWTHTPNWHTATGHTPPWTPRWTDTHPLVRHPWPCADNPLGRHPRVDTHRQTATVADGTRPTGQHSCIKRESKQLVLYVGPVPLCFDPWVTTTLVFP